MPDVPPWLPALRHGDAYPHAVDKIELIETHLSWVFLTGQWVYKLKKPIALGFVDFSTLEKRELACRDELRLNRRTVPSVYQDVVTLVDTPGGPRFTESGRVLEYAVRMRQFPQSDVLLSLADAGLLTATHIEQLARSIAAMHAAAALAPPESSFGLPATVSRYTDGCLPPIAAAIGGDQKGKFDDITHWVHAEAARLDLHFKERRSAGFIRECHGDLHLGNIVLVDGIPQPFDCLEFNAELRFIDVISDLAFVFMDLIDHRVPWLAWRLLNDWLDQTGDFNGLAALHYYAAYRALVRAKVASIRMTQPGLAGSDQAKVRSQLSSYLDLAKQLSDRRRPSLILMHGLSGSGKSVVGRSLACAVEAICLRSDVERKRPAPSARSPAPVCYSKAAIAGTYERLLHTTEPLLHDGYTVLVDATFLHHTHRQQFEELANRRSIPWLILSCEAPQAVLEERIARRQAERRDPSDATVEVLRSQISSADPLTDSERASTIVIDTSGRPDEQTLTKSVLARLNPAGVA